LLIIYTVNGGAKAIAYTSAVAIPNHFCGMAAAVLLYCTNAAFRSGIYRWRFMLAAIGKAELSLSSGKEAGGFNWNDKYNMWSGMIGRFPDCFPISGPTSLR
jgi:hypothetical protein